jgi:hypothetical protein
MTTRPFACALIGFVLVSCGARADLLDGSPDSTKGRGTLARPAATVHDAGVGTDANATASAEGVASAANVAARIVPGLVEAASDPSSSQMQQGCVTLDLSTFDRSCHVDSDCMSIASGTACPSGCFCPNDAINVDDRLRYETTIASLPFKTATCPCPSGPMPNPVCKQSVCTY